MGDVKAIGDRCLWLDRGRIRELGPNDSIVAKYLAAMAEKDSAYLGSPQGLLPHAGEASRPPEVLDHIPNIDHRHGTATFGIMLGERRGQGLGTEATRLMLDWAFTVLGLHNVDLLVFAWNRPAIRCYEKAGFRQIGRRRGGAVCMGRRFDVVIMDAIAEEFTGSVLADLVPE